MSALPATPTPRSGADLVKATRPFSEESRLRSWLELLGSAAAAVATDAIALLAPWLALRIAGSILTGLLIVRLFIIYHDALHGAIFRRSKLGNAAMWVIGMLTLSPPPVWRETHDYHHRNNCKLPGTAIGSYPIVTTRMWRRMSAPERRTYAMARHPLFILFAYFTIFVFGMCFGSFARSPKEHWAGPVAVLLHALSYGLLWMLGGWQAAVLGLLVPMLVACATGGYLFYAQHNFPEVYIADRQSWNYHDAALVSSSMFDMPWLMHQLTGNIGYHHVHHLNHRIPFYRLPVAMQQIPELQAPGRTSWRPADVRACLRLKLWDPSKRRMVPFADAQI